MSFLDCITCAFGSVVLVYVLINAQGGLRRTTEVQTTRAEVNRLEEQVLEGYQRLVEVRNAMAAADEERARAEGLGTRVVEQTEQLREQLAQAEQQTLSRREAIERLKADLKSLEEGARRLEGAAQVPDTTGTSVRAVVGDGDRQYLTGLRVGGQRILLLVDASASMLDDTVVNVIRMRNMPQSRQMLSEKWRRTVATVDWLAAQLPVDAQFQIYAFNTSAWATRASSDGQWLKASDPDALTEALQSLRQTVPTGGTSIENAFVAMNALKPLPDNVILITDGLPTQGTSAPLLRKTIDGDGRLRLFERAMARYPRAVPLNVILMPMEGDPMAASAFWSAARTTGGSFMSPARDWP